MLERVAKYSHGDHVVMVVARRLDMRSPWTAAFMVSTESSGYLPILRETCEAYASCEDALEHAWMCARSLIEGHAPRPR